MGAIEIPPAHGELASPDSMQRLEALAEDLLLDTPYAYWRSYTRSTEDGSIFYLHTWRSDDPACTGVYANMHVGEMYEDGTADYKYALWFGPDMSLLSPPGEYSDPGAALEIIDDLLDEADLTAAEEQLLNHLRENAYCESLCEKYRYPTVLSADEDWLEPQYVGDVIQDEVDSNATFTAATREWGRKFRGKELFVVSTNFIGAVPDGIESPKLEVACSYIENSSPAQHIYTKQQNGKVRFSSPIGDYGYEDLVEVSEDMLDDLKDPPEYYVRFLIDMMEKAVTYSRR